MKVIVIGGGAAGMLSAITAAKQGKQVVILEKMQSLGRKLLITGKGRCNITRRKPKLKRNKSLGRSSYSMTIQRLYPSLRFCLVQE